MIDDATTRGLPCQWCGQPSVTTIEIQPAQYRSVTKRDPVSGNRITAKEVVQRAIRVEACATHRDIADRQPPPTGNFRARRAKGVQQTSIFDVPGVSGPASAIHGDGAP